jgi:small nuclear ribonucleoprotein (snRNP)-like protein
MFTRMIVTGLVILSLSARLPVYSAGNSQTPQTTQGSQSEDVKSQIKKISIGDPVTITLINGKTSRGYLTRIGDSEFELGSAARDEYFTFRYEEVTRVDRGFDAGFKKIQTSDDPATQAPLTLDARADAVRLQITGLGLGEYVKISLRNGKKFYGLITRVDDYDFDITDFNREVIFTVRYSDVKKVDRDRNRGKWLLVSTLAMGVGAVVAVMLIARKGRDPRFPSPPFPIRP